MTEDYGKISKVNRTWSRELKLKQSVWFKIDIKQIWFQCEGKKPLETWHGFCRTMSAILYVQSLVAMVLVKENNKYCKGKIKGWPGNLTCKMKFAVVLNWCYLIHRQLYLHADLQYLPSIWKNWYLNTLPYHIKL